MVPRAAGALWTSEGCGCCAGPSPRCRAQRRLPVHLTACCCILLFPCSGLGRGGRALSGSQALGVATSPGHPVLKVTWGLLDEGMCRSTSCSGVFGNVGFLPQLRPSLNHPLPERKP